MEYLVGLNDKVGAASGSRVAICEQSGVALIRGPVARSRIDTGGQGTHSE